MNKNPLRANAEKMRDAGYSYNMINERIGVSKSTLSNWFKDRLFVPNKAVLKRIQFGPIKSATKSHNKKVKEINELKEIGAKEIGHLSKRDLWILGIGLYIGEGAKTTESIRIINSDPEVIKLAMRWFKEICGLKKTPHHIPICVKHELHQFCLLLFYRLNRNQNNHSYQPKHQLQHFRL